MRREREVARVSDMNYDVTYPGKGTSYLIHRTTPHHATPHRTTPHFIVLHYTTVWCVVGGVWCVVGENQLKKEDFNMPTGR